MALGCSQQGKQGVLVTGTEKQITPTPEAARTSAHLDGHLLGPWEDPDDGALIHKDG